jgi:hypothetical protein
MADNPRAIFERYLAAVQARDFATLRAVAHPQFEDHYPQSGEVTRGIDNLIAILQNYPGQLESLGHDRVVGGETTFVSAPNFTVLRVEGSGEHFTGIQRARYPDGSLWFIVIVAELKDGLVYRTDSFFAPAFEAPAWRSEWVDIRPRSGESPRS